MTNINATRDHRTDAWVAKLRGRLGALAASLERQPGTLALLGLGSTGLHDGRMDRYSDLDFFVIAQPDAQQHLLDDIGWLRDAAPVAYDFENSSYGRKVLFTDGVFAEYAVFTEAELDGIAEPSARVLWSRDPDRDWNEVRTRPVPRGWRHDHAAFHVGEALTNLYVGLLRERRGERLTAMRFVQVYAVDRVLALQAARSDAGTGRDPYGLERRAETWAAGVPLESFCPGYTGNVAAASAILDWLESHESPSSVMVQALRALLAGQDPGEEPS